MSDLISREEAIKAINGLWVDVGNRHENDYEYGRNQGIDCALDVIEELPSAEAEWIPCSERLPERNGAYLVWMQWTCDEELTVSIINYDADCEMFGEWHELYHPRTLGYLDSDFDEIKGVIAWMPLPEPYREESEEV